GGGWAGRSPRRRMRWSICAGAASEREVVDDRGARLRRGGGRRGLAWLLRRLLRSVLLRGVLLRRSLGLRSQPCLLIERIARRLPRRHGERGRGSVAAGIGKAAVRHGGIGRAHVLLGEAAAQGVHGGDAHPRAGI